MTIALDGSVHGSSGSSTSLTVNLTTVSAGDIICVLALSNGGGITGVTSPHLTFARRSICSIATGGFGAQTSELWWAYASSALTSEAIAVAQTSSTFITVDAFGVSSTVGFNSSNPFDSNGSLPALEATGGTAVVLSTTALNSFILFGYRFFSTASPTQGAGFTKISGVDFALSQYKLVAAAQTSLSGAIGTGSGDQNGGVGDALIESAGGGGGGGAKPVPTMPLMGVISDRPSHRREPSRRWYQMGSLMLPHRELIIPNRKAA